MRRRLRTCGVQKKMIDKGLVSRCYANCIDEVLKIFRLGFQMKYLAESSCYEDWIVRKELFVLFAFWG